MTDLESYIVALWIVVFFAGIGFYGTRALLKLIRRPTRIMIQFPDEKTK